MKLLSLVFLLSLAACQNSEQTPESALKDFVEHRVGQVIDQDFIRSKVTGKMLEVFENMPAEDFKKFSDMSNIKSDSFKILSKSCEAKKCILTYSIGYTTKNGEKAQFQSEVKKIAELVQVEDKWLISEVNNVQTYHESLEPINPLQE